MNAHEYGRYLYLYRRHLSVHHGNVDHVYKYDLSFLIDEQYFNPLCLECDEVVTDGADWYPEEAEKLAVELAERRSSTGFWTQSLANHPEAIRWTHAFDEHGVPECIVEGWIEKRRWEVDNVRRLAESGDDVQLWSTYEERPVDMTLRITTGGGQSVESAPFTDEDFTALPDVSNEELEDWAQSLPPAAVWWSARPQDLAGTDMPHTEGEPTPLFVILIEPEHPDAAGTYEDGMPLKVCISDGMCYHVTLNGPSMRLSDGSILTVRAGEWGGHVEAIISGKEVENGEEAQNAPRRVAWRSRREHRQSHRDE